MSQTRRTQVCNSSTLVQSRHHAWAMATSSQRVDRFGRLFETHRPSSTLVETRKHPSKVASACEQNTFQWVYNKSLAKTASNIEHATPSPLRFFCIDPSASCHLPGQPFGTWSGCAIHSDWCILQDRARRTLGWPSRMVYRTLAAATLWRFVHLFHANGSWPYCIVLAAMSEHATHTFDV